MATPDKAPIGPTEQLLQDHGDNIRKIVLDPYIRSLMESRMHGHDIPGEGETVGSLVYKHIQEIYQDIGEVMPPEKAVICALEMCEISVRLEGVERGEA